jgi:hypothetical protein
MESCGTLRQSDKPIGMDEVLSHFTYGVMNIHLATANNWPSSPHTSFYALKNLITRAPESRFVSLIRDITTTTHLRLGSGIPCFAALYCRIYMANRGIRRPTPRPHQSELRHIHGLSGCRAAFRPWCCTSAAFAECALSNCTREHLPHFDATFS